MSGIVQNLQSIIHSNPSEQGLQALFVSAEESAKQMAAAAKRRVELAIAEKGKPQQVSAAPASRNPPHLGKHIDIHA